MTTSTLTELLTEIKDGIRGETVTIGQLLEDFHERGFGFFLFLFSFPAALPLPAIGINVILALPLILLTSQQAIGKEKVWMPESIRKKEISRQKLENLIEKASPWIKKLEFFVRPRLGFITKGKASNVIGAMGVIMALSVCVPIPLTNTVPSFGIAAMATGVLMGDGLAVLAGAATGITWVCLLIFFGQAGIEFILSMIGL